MVAVVYIGSDPSPEIIAVWAGFRAVAEPGVPLEVPDEVAHGAPGWEKRDENGVLLDEHPGYSGVLAQTDLWKLAPPTSGGARPPKPDKADSPVVPTPTPSGKDEGNAE